MAKRFYRFLCDEWQGILTVGVIGAIGGGVPTGVMLVWYYSQLLPICW